MTDSLQASSALGQPQPLNDAITSLPPHMVPPLQFLHVPARPGSNRRQKSAHQLPSKVPIPVYTLKKLPTPESLMNPLPAPPSIDGSRPPTAPSSSTLHSRGGSAQTARVLFSRFHQTSASATVASSNGERCGSGGVRQDSHRDEDVSWTERSPRVAAGTRNRAPPLAEAINAYLAREMKLLGDASECEEGQQTAHIAIDPMEALQPHREAFRMLAEGLPSYASLMCNIMTAFDSAVKSQACVTSAARVISNTAYQVRVAHESEVSELRREIEAVEERCRQSQLALQAKLTEAKTSASVGVISTLEQENISLKAQLDENQLEKTNDLEKFMTLIAAIKECDNRVKTLEDALQDARVKLDDMHMLKKMMGESQSELGQLKAMYRDAVPLARFTNATRELEDQLRESKQETKRVRRLCIARGSAIDILERKLKAVTDDLDRFRLAAGSKSVREALTPRPDWLSIQESIPELREFAADIPVEMIDVDGQQPRKIVGMKDTSLQVSFLVDKVAELQSALDAARSTCVATSPIQMETSPPSSLKQRQSIVGTTTSSSKALIKEIALPMFAAGLHVATTPAHLREIGTIPRITLESAKIKELTLDFFSGNLRKNPEAALLLSPAELSKHLVAFCTLTFATSPEIRQQYSGNVVYLVHNLLEQSMHSPIPQLVLLRHVMAGTMPLRVAFDALDVIGEVRRELNALCEAHNKTRLRRATVVELIIPLLAFKSRDEIEELRATLGVENTIDVAALVAPTSKLMGTLFEQECLEGMKLYSAMVDKLSSTSVITDGVRTTSTSAVLDALAVVEPKTLQRVIDALIVGDVTDETVFPLEHTITALRSTPLVRLSSKPQ